MTSTVIMNMGTKTKPLIKGRSAGTEFADDSKKEELSTSGLPALRYFFSKLATHKRGAARHSVAVMDVWNVKSAFLHGRARRPTSVRRNPTNVAWGLSTETTRRRVRRTTAHQHASTSWRFDLVSPWRLDHPMGLGRTPAVHWAVTTEGRGCLNRTSTRTRHRSQTHEF